MGDKFFILADAVTKYIYRFQIYTCTSKAIGDSSTGLCSRTVCGSSRGAIWPRALYTPTITTQVQSYTNTCMTMGSMLVELSEPTVNAVSMILSWRNLMKAFWKEESSTTEIMTSVSSCVERQENCELLYYSTCSTQCKEYHSYTSRNSWWVRKYLVIHFFLTTKSTWGQLILQINWSHSIMLVDIPRNSGDKSCTISWK